MSRIRIIRRRRPPRTDQEPSPIPAWLDDPEEIAPCPCGKPPDEECMVVTGETPLKRWFHVKCLDWLETEMDDEEIEEKREWEKRMRGDGNG